MEHFAGLEGGAGLQFASRAWDMLAARFLLDEVAASVEHGIGSDRVARAIALVADQVVASQPTMVPG